MKQWLMSEIGVEEIIVNANSFDNAIQEARKIDSRYSGGHIAQYFAIYKYEYEKDNERVYSKSCMMLRPSNKPNEESVLLNGNPYKAFNILPKFMSKEVS